MTAEKKTKKKKTAKAQYVGGKAQRFPTSVPRSLQALIKEVKPNSSLDVSDRGHDIVSGLRVGTRVITTDEAYIDRNVSYDTVTHDTLAANVVDVIDVNEFDFIHFNCAAQPRGILFCLLAAANAPVAPKLIVMRNCELGEASLRGASQFMTYLGQYMYDMTISPDGYVAFQLRDDVEISERTVNVIVNADKPAYANEVVGLLKVRALLGPCATMKVSHKNIGAEHVVQDAETIYRVLQNGDAIAIPAVTDASWIPCLPDSGDLSRSQYGEYCGV